MLVSEFDTYVQSTDRSFNKTHKDRLDIAIYGLNAEIGSVVAAVKKSLLAEGGAEAWAAVNDEIVEELGDVIWYCFSLAKAANPLKPINIFAHDIANLKREIEGIDERAERIRGILDPTKRDAFLAAAKKFPKSRKIMVFEDYQKIAFLTARTKDRTLVEVCLAVLWQLGAQLFRCTLPAIELELNKSLVDRELNDVLGEIAWHVSALASIYNLQLSHIAQKNIEKISFRFDKSRPTPLHDNGRLPSEQFPRRFEVSIVTIAERRSRMYLDNRQLGDDLTDNSYEDDGYRYHDILHLANVAKLGWSPVLRGLMGLKRKSDAKIDEVEDGARAKIVEEAVIKAIHSEGARIAKLLGPALPGVPQLFSNGSDITFRFLKFIRSLVSDLEVHENRYWEWEEAILAGHDIFRKLHCEGQGTVIVDLEARSIIFQPEVCVGLVGKIAGLGSAYFDKNMLFQDPRIQKLRINSQGEPVDQVQAIRLIAQQFAVLAALGNQQPSADDLTELRVSEIHGKGISVKATGSVQSAMWARKVVAFRTTTATTQSGGCHCTAIAVADD